MNVGISFVVPLFNPSEIELHRLISGFLEQDENSFEVVFVDDFSDNFQQISERIVGANLPFNFSIVRNTENIGIADTLNYGISRAINDWVAFVDQDDFLEPKAVKVLKSFIAQNKKSAWMFTDESIVTPSGDEFRIYKNEFNIVELESCMYINHLQIFNRAALGSDLHFKGDSNGSQDHELAIRLSRKGYSPVRIPISLYKWYEKQDSFSRKGAKNGRLNTRCVKASLSALNEGISGGKFVSILDNGIYTFVPNQLETKVSLIVPTGGKRKRFSKELILRSFVKSLHGSISNKDFANYEIVVITSNQNDLSAVRNLLDEFPFPFKVSIDHGQFNFSRKINLGVELATNEELIFINDDIEILTSDSIASLLGFKMHYDLAVVGPLILDKKLRIQSAGDRVGENSIHHIGTGLDPRYGLGTRTALLSRQVSSVTGAFFSIRKQLYKSLGGFDESLASSYQDVVFCNKVRSAGMNLAIYANVRVKHLEGVTRGKSISPHEKAIAFSRLEESLSSKDPFGFYQVNGDQLILKRIHSLSKVALLQILRKISHKLSPKKRVSVKETEVGSTK